MSGLLVLRRRKDAVRGRSNLLKVSLQNVEFSYHSRRISIHCMKHDRSIRDKSCLELNLEAPTQCQELGVYYLPLPEFDVALGHSRGPGTCELGDPPGSPTLSWKLPKEVQGTRRGWGSDPVGCWIFGSTAGKLDGSC